MPNVKWDSLWIAQRGVGSVVKMSVTDDVAENVGSELFVSVALIPVLQCLEMSVPVCTAW